MTQRDDAERPEAFDQDGEMPSFPGQEATISEASDPGPVPPEFDLDLSGLEAIAAQSGVQIPPELRDEMLAQYKELVARHQRILDTNQAFVDRMNATVDALPEEERNTLTLGDAVRTAFFSGAMAAMNMQGELQQWGPALLRALTAFWSDQFFEVIGVPMSDRINVRWSRPEEAQDGRVGMGEHSVNDLIAYYDEHLEEYLRHER